MSLGTRTVALDGLRGVAAVVVLASHLMAVSPIFQPTGTMPAVDDPFLLALAFTPLHLFWAGPEAVMVFFVLSGVVLTRAAASDRFDWAAYLPSRLVRLYVPVIAAVAIAWALYTVLPDNPELAGTWMDRSGVHVGTAMRAAVLVDGVGQVIAPLWSLRWEVLFSVFLVVFVLAFRRVPPWATGLACLVLVLVGGTYHEVTLTYLPVFGVGVALALGWERLAAPLRALPPAAGALVRGSAFVLALLGLLIGWLVRIPFDQGLLGAALNVVTVVSAAAIVFLVAEAPALAAVFSSRPIRFLGAISFSLYLVHEPLVIGTAEVFGRSWVTAAVAAALAIPVAWVFWRLVERPGHVLAHRVRDGIRERTPVAASLPGDGPRDPDGPASQPGAPAPQGA